MNFIQNIAPGRVVALALGLCIAGAAHAQDARTAMNGEVELSYRVFGEADDPALIFIEGLAGAVRPGGDALTDALVVEDFRIIRFDSRDAGQSTILAEAGPSPSNAAIIGALMAGEEPAVA